MPHEENRFKLPDPLQGSAGRGQRTMVTAPGKRGQRRAVKPSEFLTSINEGREEGEDEFTRENLPEGFSIGGGARGQRETVSSQASAPSFHPRSGPEGVPEVPSPSNPETAEALDSAEAEQRKRSSRQRGRASTIMTGGQGLQTSAPIARRTLMGS